MASRSTQSPATTSVQQWWNETIAEFAKEAKMLPADAARLTGELGDIAMDYSRKGRSMTAKDAALARQAGNLAITTAIVRTLGREDRRQIALWNMAFGLLIASVTPNVDLAALSR